LPDLVAAISELRQSAMLRATRAGYAAKSVTHANGLLVNFNNPAASCWKAALRQHIHHRCRAGHHLAK
jgi:hypothetical protein